MICRSHWGGDLFGGGAFLNRGPSEVANELSKTLRGVTGRGRSLPIQGGGGTFPLVHPSENTDCEDPFSRKRLFGPAVIQEMETHLSEPLLEREHRDPTGASSAFLMSFTGSPESVRLLSYLYPFEWYTQKRGNLPQRLRDSRLICGSVCGGGRSRGLAAQ